MPRRFAGLNLGQNIFYHEYMLVRREAGQDRFPPVEMEGYLRDLARGLLFVSDPGRRSEMRDVLVSHGWKDDSEPPAAPSRPHLRERLRARMNHLRADYLSARPTDLATIGLRSEARALRCTLSHSPAPTPNAFLTPLEPLLLQ